MGGHGGTWQKQQQQELQARWPSQPCPALASTSRQGQRVRTQVRARQRKEERARQQQEQLQRHEFAVSYLTCFSPVFSKLIFPHLGATIVCSLVWATAFQSIKYIGGASRMQRNRQTDRQTRQDKTRQDKTNQDKTDKP